MNTGESNRPSLVAGTDRSPAGTRPRASILADMENRKPDKPAVAARRKPLLWLLILACAVLVILAFLQLSARMFAPGAEGLDSQTGRETFGQTAPATQAPALDPSGTVERGGAMIVDDPAAEETRAALATIASASAESDTAAPAAAQANASSGASGTRRQVPTASRAPATRASRTATPPEPATGSTDLISTLLRIIKQDGTASAQQHESMDALIAQVQAEDDRTRSQNSAALASLGGPGETGTRPTRSPVVQEKLRACPKANTVAGIECRSQVCAQHAGEDAACPQQ